MYHTPFFIAAYFIVELCFIATMCRVLAMRSKGIYVFAALVAYTLNYFFIGSGISATFRAVSFGLPHSILLPILCSTDPLKTRLSRVTLINLCILAIDFLGLSLLTPIYQHLLPRQGLATDAVDITSVYILSGPLLIPFFGAFAAICRRIDRRGQANGIGTRIVAACLLAYLPICLFDLALSSSNQQDWGLATLGLLSTLLSIAFCLATLWAAERETQLAREQANRAARLRQERHLRAEVASTIRRSTAIRHLRHDLANQISVVEELAGRGQVTEAQDYLAALCVQAHSISESAQATIHTFP